MIGSTVISGLLGAAFKAIAGFLTEQQKLKRETQMLLAGAKLDEIRTMYGGKDRSTPNIEWVRRLLVMTIFGVLSFGMLYGLMFYPELKYSILVDKDPSWLSSLFFGQTSKGVMTVSFLSLFYEYVNFGAMIMGFYMMKVWTGK